MSDEDAPKDADSGLPPTDFGTFVLSLSHSALVHLGDAPDPASGHRESNLPMAQHSIDMLAMLHEKTKGNLTGEEERILDQTLYDLRMRFVEVSRSG